jgi:peptide/nickel transport system substrate-binding protein
MFLVAACASPSAPAASSSGSTTTGAVTPGASGAGAPAATTAPAAVKKGGTFTDVSFADAITMNPILANDNASRERYSLMFDGLTTYDEKTLELKPNLAASWKFSEDKLSVTYTLKDNIFWSDGRPITSADYKFTWEKLFDPATKVPVRSTLEVIDGVPTTPDAKTITFKFKQITAVGFLVTDNWAAIPKHVFENESINDTPKNSSNNVGSGPFVMKEWVKDSAMTFVPNDRYHRGRPHLDQYIFRVVANANAGFQALKTGEVDTHQLSSPAEWDELTKLPDVNAMSYYYYAAAWDYIGFNTRLPMFSDKRTRQAITSALNRKAMVERVLLGHGKEQNSVFPATSPVFTDDVPKFPYDQNKARQLLREAGWTPGPDGILTKGGERFKTRIHYNTGNTRREQIATIAQQQLREVGIEVEVVSEEFGAYVERVRSGKDFDMFLLGWVGGSDPDFSRNIWMTDKSQNYTGYSNAEVDRLFPQADMVFDMQKERRPLYERIQKIVAEDQPYVFLWTLETLVGFNKRIAGPQPVPLGTRETKWNVHEWHSLTGK